MIALTASREAYLMCLYQLDPDGNGTRLTDLAEGMDVALSSAYAAVKELESLGLLSKSGSRMIYLAPEGRKEAARLSSRRATLERFFTDILGIELQAAQRDAEAIEPILSDDSYRALARMAG